jgi:hypothetical protein
MMAVIYAMRHVHEMGERNVTMYVDVTGGGLKNMDLTTFRQVIELHLKGFAKPIFDHVVIYGLSMILKPFAKLVLSILPAKFKRVVEISSREDVLSHIAFEEPFPPPEGCSTLMAIGLKHGIALKEIEAEIQRTESLRKSYTDTN